MADDVEKCYAKKQTQDIKTRINNAYNDGLGDCFRKTVDLLSSGMKNYNTANIILRNINTLGMLSYLDMQIKNLTEDQNSMLISDANMLVNKIIDNSDTPFTPAFMRPFAAASSEKAACAAAEQAVTAVRVASGSASRVASCAAASPRLFVLNASPRSSAMPRSSAIG